MKKFLTVLTAGCILLNLLTVSVFGAIATGKIINNRTYVPVRGVFEELGFTVSYDSTTAIAKISNDKYTIEIPKNKNYFLVNNQTIKPETPQIVIDNSLYLPLRAIGDSIGANTSWDSKNKTASISFTDKTSTIFCSNSTNTTMPVTYREYPNIPDFGAITGAKLKTSSKEADGMIYLYELNFTNDDIQKYINILEKAGFSYVSNIDNYYYYSNSDAELTVVLYKKSSVCFCIFVYDVSVSLY